jgi:AbrB family looped-hinge helix DNA binding protein
MTYSAKVIAGGKIVIPADLRRELGIKDGDKLVLERDATGGIVLKTYAQVVREVQEAFRAMRGGKPGSGTVVDEFLAERRVAAEEEEAEYQEWSRTHGQ